MSNLSILFIPGSYVLLPVYHLVFDAVSAAEHDIKGIHLPTIGPSSRQGREGPAPSMYDDAAIIAQEGEKLADQGKDVILVTRMPRYQCLKVQRDWEKRRESPKANLEASFNSLTWPVLSLLLAIQPGHS
jgi:hypothetical protein